MAKRATKKNIRKLTRQGKRSIGVIVPADIIRTLRWREKQKVVVTRKGSIVSIRDWKPKKKKK